MKYDEINDLIDSSDEIVENWRKNMERLNDFNSRLNFMALRSNSKSRRLRFWQSTISDCGLVI